MNTKDATKWFGSQQKLADALGVHQTTVCTWKETPPDLQQIRIERLTKGNLKAEPSCYLPPVRDAAKV